MIKTRKVTEKYTVCDICGEEAYGRFSTEDAPYHFCYEHSGYGSITDVVIEGSLIKGVVNNTELMDLIIDYAKKHPNSTDKDDE